jgi:hypothetical protein
MDAVVPWVGLLALIAPHYPKGGPKGGRDARGWLDGGCRGEIRCQRIGRGTSGLKVYVQLYAGVCCYLAVRIFRDKKDSFVQPGNSKNRPSPWPEEITI